MRQLPSGGLRIDLSGQCRMQGGTNSGAPSGNRNARKHGGRSAEALAAARYLREFARLVQSMSEE